jgi:MoxR-like ATPase
VRLVRATRVTKPEAPDFVKDWVRWGAGPRAAQYLVLGAKAHALIQGRTYVSTDDVKAVAHPVLRHRVLTNFQAEAEGVTPDIVVDRLLATIPAHDRGALTGAGVPDVLGS